MQVGDKAFNAISVIMFIVCLIITSVPLVQSPRIDISGFAGGYSTTEGGSSS